MCVCLDCLCLWCVCVCVYIIHACVCLLLCVCAATWRWQLNGCVWAVGWLAIIFSYPPSLPPSLPPFRGWHHRAHRPGAVVRPFHRHLRHGLVYVILPLPPSLPPPRLRHHRAHRLGAEVRPVHRHLRHGFLRRFRPQGFSCRTQEAQGGACGRSSPGDAEGCH